MSATELREAARLMRERAIRGASPVTERWVAAKAPVPHVWNEWHDDEGRRCRKPVAIETDTQGQADFIASWHPAIALAVADLLDIEAEMATDTGPGWAVDEALAVARAYLGTDVSTEESPRTHRAGVLGQPGAPAR